ncbi:hypothetical protein EWM64_g6670 [Hericium alpestre]|uniref:3'-5' exonuclease domain-containing protein n=1 Tax=Hericium alpestre TaxID=135208 RepID=A0A4Y9ZTI7_9AGAM|nr:hypothetical protein EWM64_g6670 [Hericium alpestre]
MPSEPAPTTQKRGPGRPKGSKNKESAGAVGRPPKGGGPPRKNQPSSGSDVAERSQDSSTGSRLKQTKLSFVVPAPKGPCAREPPKSQDRPRGLDSGNAADVPVASPHSDESTVPPERAVERASRATSTATGSDTPASQNAAAQDGAAIPDSAYDDSASSASHGRDPTAAVAPRVAISADLTQPANSSRLISGRPPMASSSSAIGLASAVPQKGSDAPQQIRAQGGPSKTPSHGKGAEACPEYVRGPVDLGGVDDVDIDYLLGETGEDANEEDEFQPVPDDDEPVLASPETAALKNQPADGNKRRETQSRSTMPLWLKSVYAEMRERLISEMKTNASRRPTCYDQGSYTIGGPISFYNANHKIVSPADFYRPFFFVWLPHLFLKDGILCPACVHARRTRRSNNQPVTLQLNGWPDSPRRVTDLEYNLYLVGQRYRCGHPDCNTTYQPWSPAILDILPPALAAQFTLLLTYRGGLTDRLAALLRSSFRNGVGPTAFKDMISSFHYRYYEQLHIRYLEHVHSRQQGLVGGLYGEPNSKFTWFGNFDDRNRYAGSVPSRNYFQLFYGHYLSPWAHDMNKRMAMLSARYLAVDHSHKLSKRLAKVAGQTVFGALHTTVNEYGEIRQMTLTPTKGHDQFMPALGQMPDSLVTYGHGDIELVFTDSTRADKAELERIFPALRHNVHPVPNHSLLPMLEIPPDWSTWILSSEYQIRNQITCIMDDLAKLDDAEELKVGFDMEWSVDRINGIQGRIAILQISYGKDIFILQLRSFLRDGFLHLPPVLLTFLQSSRIRKVGVHVKADLTWLFKDCQQDTKSGSPFGGALELGQLAKAKNAADRANIGLADLVARTLHRCLDKDESTHISNHWSEPILTKQQEQYAVTDAYACWAVFEVLKSSPSPGAPVSLQSPEGTPVELLSRDCTQVIARGVLLSDRPKECRVPGYCIPANLSPTKEPIALSALQEKESLPLTLYFKFAHLRTSASSPSSPMSQPLHLTATCPANAPSTSVPHVTPSTSAPSTSALHVTASNLLAESSASIAVHETLNQSPGDAPLPDMADAGDDSPTGSWYDEIEYDPAIEQVPEMAHSDAASAQCAQQLRSTVKPQEPEVIRLHVLGDIWHLMDQFKIAVHHGLRRPFARALRDAIFIPDPEDKAAIEDVLKK